MVDSGRIGGCGNTCVLYLDTVVTMGKRDIGRGKITTVALTEIKVPTLITMEREHVYYLKKY